MRLQASYLQTESGSEYDVLTKDALFIRASYLCLNYKNNKILIIYGLILKIFVIEYFRLRIIIKNYDEIIKGIIRNEKENSNNK